MRHVDTNSTDQSIRVWAYDEDGAAITGQAHSSPGIAASVVVRSAGRIVSTTGLTLVARTSVGVHRDSAITEVGGGEYVIDLPDSCFATADREVSVTLTSTAISGGYVLSESLEVSAALATKAVVDSIAVALAGSAPVEPTGATVFELLEEIAGQAGTGARTVTITVNDGTTMMQNARVRLTEGANTFTALTNASGVATLNVDDATYTVAITKSGYTFAGTTLVVDGTEAVTYSMTATSITPGGDTGEVTGYLTVRDEVNNAESGVTIYCRMLGIDDSSTGDAHDGANRTEVSAGNGLVQFEGLLIGGTYEFWRVSDSAARKVTIPDTAETQAGTYALPDIIGGN